MIPFANPSVQEVFNSYPDSARSSMLALRDLVFLTAQRMGVEKVLEETLKWGVPSYLCPNGATLRMDWKEGDPDHYRMFFHCQTKLVSTFRRLYPDFQFEGNRAIRLDFHSEPDLYQLSHCIEMSLNYHAIKHDLSSIKAL